MMPLVKHTDFFVTLTSLQQQKQNFQTFVNVFLPSPFEKEQQSTVKSQCYSMDKVLLTVGHNHLSLQVFF